MLIYKKIVLFQLKHHNNQKIKIKIKIKYEASICKVPKIWLKTQTIPFLNGIINAKRTVVIFVVHVRSACRARACILCECIHIQTKQWNVKTQYFCTKTASILKRSETRFICCDDLLYIFSFFFLQKTSNSTLLSVYVSLCVFFLSLFSFGCDLFCPTP